MTEEDRDLLEEQPKKKNKLRNVLLTLVYLAFNIGVILVIGLQEEEGISQLPKTLASLDWRWLTGGVVCMLVYLFVDGVMVFIMVKRLVGTASIWDSMRAALTGKYYNAITPFASGGQPFQILYMYKIGIPVTASTTCTMVKYIVGQAALFTFSVFALATQWLNIWHHSQLIFWAAMGGVVTNFGMPVLFYILSTNRGVVQKVLTWCFKLGAKMKLIKNYDEQYGKLLEQAEVFHNGMILLRTDWRLVLKLYVAAMLDVGSMLAISYMIYRSLGQNEVSVFTMVMTHTFLYLAVSYFPTPGASGWSEGGFSVLFSLFFTAGTVYAGMLLWRVSSYYVTLVAGGGVILLDTLFTFIRSRTSKERDRMNAINNAKAQALINNQGGKT